MTTLVLWPSPTHDYAETHVLGKPVWQRTLESALPLKPRKCVWVGEPPGEELTETRPGKLETMGDALLILPAELPCLRTRTLRRLLAASSRGTAALTRGDVGTPVALAVKGRALKKLSRAGLRSFEAMVRELRPTPVFAEGTELLSVESTASWSEAHTVLRERKLEALMRRGVLIPEPSTVLVDPEVSVSKGALLWPFVRIEGSSKIGAGCRIGSFSHIVDTTIGRGTTVLDHCYLRDSRIGKLASIGPFAHLRPDSDVGDRARVGNFVELKKSSLGAGAKAPHLAYIGDATVGPGANLGAGTITCNYDGRRKSRTVVGDGAFIGSDVQLVAPVRVGKGAFVAAGSCIVEDVPAYALALARSRQVVKKNWAKKRNDE